MSTEVTIEHIMLVPTTRCNFRCGHCMYSSEKEGEDIDLDFAKGYLDQLPALKTESVCISGGGEPTLYPNLIELIQYCDGIKKGGYLKTISMITNGSWREGPLGGACWRRERAVGTTQVAEVHLV